MNATTSEDFFELKYRQAPDPWDFATSPYELERYRAILRLMGDSIFPLAFEPACSVGVLTEMVAPRCQWLEAYDIAPTAVKRAKERCHLLRHVNIFKASIHAHCPVGGDLYLLSEVGYYMPQAALQSLLATHVACLSPGAVVIACHWLGHSADHVLSGDQVHQLVHHTSGLVHQRGDRHAGYRLDRWVKAAKA